MYPKNLSRSATAAIAIVCAGIVVAGCSSSSSDATSSTPETSASASADLPGTEAMRALCDQMVADKLSPEDATALAEQNGYVARVGAIDGTPQAVTMDFREDRFTFDVTNGAVTACSYG